MSNLLSSQDNPFLDPQTAKLWIDSVENESGQFRDTYIYPIIRRWLEESDVRRVLDIGSGQGIVSTLVGDREYVGVEPSETLLTRAREKYGDREFVVGNAYQLPCVDESFDGAVSVNVWFHLADIEKAAAEMARVLRPEGSFLIVNPNPDVYDVWRAFYSGSQIEGKRIEGTIVAPGVLPHRSVMFTHTEAEIFAAFSAYDLVLEREEKFSPISEQDDRCLFTVYLGKKK